MFTLQKILFLNNIFPCLLLACSQNSPVTLYFFHQKIYRWNICCMVHFSTFYWDTSAIIPCMVALSWASTTSDTSSSSFLFSMLDTNWIILDSQLFNLDCKEHGFLCIRLKSCTVTYHFIVHGGTAKTNYQSDCYKQVFLYYEAMVPYGTFYTSHPDFSALRSSVMTNFAMVHC